MKKIKLNNGVEMPMEGYGVFQVTDLMECKKSVSEALNVGYRLIDTASSYQNETAVGAAIRGAIEKGIVTRDELFITTKAYIQEMGYDNTIRAFEQSLHNLGLEYLDLYLIHMPFGDYYGSYSAMEELYEAGKIRAIGVSNFDPARLMDLCYNVKVIPQINQLEMHPHFQRAEEIKVMKDLGVQAEAWAPFAEGLKGMFSEPILLELADKYRKTPAQIILRWNIQRGIIIITKTVHKEHMEENLNIWDFEISSEDVEKIFALDKNCPSMLDVNKPSEVKRVYDYLRNPVLTSLNKKISFRGKDDYEKAL